MKEVLDLPALGARDPESHKGTYGRVLIVAGSRGMSGAAILAGMGALRGGAGLVQVATTKEVQPIVASYNPCYLTAALPQDAAGYLASDAEEELSQLLAKADVLAIGPGLGQTTGISQVLRALVSQAKCPVVIDADGLNLLSGMTPFDRWAPNERRWVLTPHPAEFARLCHVTTKDVQERREELATRFASQNKVVVALKGHRTLVTDGECIYRNSTGNPGMATGGTGDVLTGLIAALLGQGMEPFASSQLGVYLHGLAGDLATQEIGQSSLIAADLLQYLGTSFCRHFKKSETSSV